MFVLLMESEYWRLQFWLRVLIYCSLIYVGPPNPYSSCTDFLGYEGMPCMVLVGPEAPDCPGLCQFSLRTLVCLVTTAPQLWPTPHLGPSSVTCWCCSVFHWDLALQVSQWGIHLVLLPGVSEVHSAVALAQAQSSDEGLCPSSVPSSCMGRSL